MWFRLTEILDQMKADDGGVSEEIERKKDILAKNALAHTTNNETHNKIRGYESKIQECRRWLDDAEKMEKVAVSPEIREKASDSLTAILGMKDMIRALENEKVGLTARLDVETKTLSEIEKREKTGILNRGVKADLERCRALLHRNEAPARVAAAYVEKINDNLTEWQKDLDVPPFRIDESFNFVVEEGAKSIPLLQAMSVGQRRVAAIAFRMSLLDLVGGVGFMVFDEPTAYVDSDNIRTVADAFRKLGDKAGRTGLTIWVATHESRLFPVMTGRINLKK
jgi:hypothetical protein